MNSPAFRSTFLIFITLSCGHAFAEEWGDLRGRFVLGGTAPRLPAHRVTVDVNEFGKTVPDESLLVDPKNNGLANVAVILEEDEELNPHPMYDGADKTEATLTANKGRFIPRVLLMRTGQPLKLVNQQSVGAHFKFEAEKNSSINMLLPAKGERTLAAMKRPEPSPFLVQSYIHVWIRGYVVFQNTPYMTVSGANGAFAIPKLPVGEHRFRLWHEKAGYLGNVMQDGKQLTDDEGYMTLTIPESGLDLMDITLPAALFTVE